MERLHVLVGFSTSHDSCGVYGIHRQWHLGGFQRWRLEHSCSSKLREKTEGRIKGREREWDFCYFVSIVFSLILKRKVGTINPSFFRPSYLASWDWKKEENEGRSTSGGDVYFKIWNIFWGFVGNQLWKPKWCHVSLWVFIRLLAAAPYFVERCNNFPKVWCVLHLYECAFDFHWEKNNISCRAAF